MGSATRDGRRSREWRTALALVSIGVGLVVMAGLLALSPTVQRWSGDVRLFEDSVSALLREGDTTFLEWYPSLAVVPLAIPLLAGSGAAYTFAFTLEMAVVATLGGGLVDHLARRTEAPSALRLYALLLLVVAPIVVWRFDIAPAVIVLGSLAAVVAQRWTSGLFLLALAAGVKVYPVFLAPIVAWHGWRVAGARSLALMAAGGAIGAALTLGVYLMFPGSSPADLLAFTAARPLHVESVAGAPLALAMSLGGVDPDIGFGYGSYNLGGDVAATLTSLLSVVQPILVIGTSAVAMLRISRGPSAGTLVLAALSVLLAVLITNRVLSAQYLVWILPLVPLVVGAPRALGVSAIVLTGVFFPWLYTSVVELEPIPLILVNLRNLALVAAWVAVVAQLTREPRATEEARPQAG